MRHLKNQTGAVMVIALILLMILFFVTTTGLKTGLIESQMAGNEQVRLETFERALSIVESVISDEANLIASGSVGATNCFNLSGCSQGTVAIDSSLLTGDHSDRSSVEVLRLAPLYSPPPRGMASSASLFEVASMQVEATYDGATAQLGKSTIGQGVMVLVRK